jgi:hypothetical protein
MGRTLLAFGVVVLGSLAAAPASACGADDRFPCAQTSQSSDAKSDQTTSASKPVRSTTKVRAQRKRLAAKKPLRNASRAKIIQTAAKTKSRSVVSKRVEEISRAEPSPRVEASPRIDVRARIETPASVDETPPTQTASLPEKTAVESPAPLYQIASAEPAPLFTAPAAPTSDLLVPVPTAGAGEMIRFATANQAAEPEQLSNSAPIVAASEAPIVEFKADPARLFDKRAVMAERANPRKNAPNGLSWMQAVLLALGGGIVATSTFMLFSARTRRPESA